MIVPWNDADAVAQGRRGAHPGGDHRRAGAGQHGRRPRRSFGFLDAPSRPRRRERRPADPRRGDHRLPRRARRRPGDAAASNADLTVMGKVLGGGLPAAAYGGSRKLMERVAPGGRRLPGGHPVGQSAGGRRRARDAVPARRGGLPPPGRDDRAARGTCCRRPPAIARCGSCSSRAC